MSWRRLFEYNAKRYARKHRVVNLHGGFKLTSSDFHLHGDFVKLVII
jgi:hypothetical protein